MIAKTCGEESHFDPVSRHAKKSKRIPPERRNPGPVIGFGHCQVDPEKHLLFLFLGGGTWQSPSVLAHLRIEQPTAHGWARARNYDCFDFTIQ